MNAASFDTLAAAEALQAGGFTSEQAKALVEVQRKALADFESNRELATKKDLLELKADLIRWVVGSSLALAAFLVAVMAWLRP